MNDAVNPFLPHEGEHSLEIADVHADETEIPASGQILDILKITGISQLVQNHYPVIRVVQGESSCHMASDEAGTAGDKDTALVH